MPAIVWPPVPVGMLAIYVIYDRPADCPDGIVVRPQYAGRGEILSAQTGYAFATLEETRAALPLGLTRLPRHVDDAPTILETWI